MSNLYQVFMLASHRQSHFSLTTTVRVDSGTPVSQMKDLRHG